jgi:hypothetical protein
MTTFNHIRFHVYRWLYLNLNEIAKHCYEQYWKILNDDDDQTPDAGNPILAV